MLGPIREGVNKTRKQWMAEAGYPSASKAIDESYDALNPEAFNAGTREKMEADRIKRGIKAMGRK